jgi:uncharacterized membrane protein YjjP (DUF1212 family)
MPYGALFQVRQAVELARYLPRWQQNLLAAGLLAGAIVLLAFGDLVGLAPLACVALFVITSIHRRIRKRWPPSG